MSQYILRKIGQPPAKSYPFAVSIYKGDKPISDNEKGYSVNNGICYSTFSYSSGSYIPIENMNTAIEVGKDYGVYIKFGVSQNMQITGAKIISSKVGVDAQDGEWKDYPDFYKIRPFDKTKDGKVVTIVDGKRQEEGYLMIGKCYDHLDEFSKDYPFLAVSSLKNKWSGYFVQYVDQNIIMMGSQISGVPVVFPMPFWGGPATSDKEKLKIKK